MCVFQKEYNYIIYLSYRMILKIKARVGLLFYYYINTGLNYLT